MEAPPRPAAESSGADDAPTPGRPNVLIRSMIKLDTFQRRHAWVAVPLAVNKRFGEHEGPRLAATVSYYSFFSVFPLLLVFVTVLGIILDDNPELRQQLVDGAVGQIPLIGNQLTAEQTPLEGNIPALIIGVLTALWAGMGAAGALQQGLDDVADVPMHRRSNFAFKRVRVLLFLLAIAVGLGASVLLTNLATLFDLGPFAGAAGLLGTVVVNAALILAMYTVLPSERPSLRQQLPGAVVAGILLVALQLLGSYVVRRFIAGASDTYGTFAVVIALLSWFHLLSRILLMSAQLNVVLERQLWPRRLIGDTPLTEGDRRALLLDVQRVQRDPTVGYAVAVDGTVGTNDDPLGERSL